ncbi:hypothetical protein PGB90_004081 [Kerria lacca]
MYSEKITEECGLQSSMMMSSGGPILTVLPTLTRLRRNQRFHPLSQQQPLLYRPHLNLPVKERSPSPPQVGTHISCLYPEILAHIFSYLDVKAKGRATQVCLAWKEASYHKSVWKGVEAKLHLQQRRINPTLVSSLTRRGIKRIQILSVVKSFREITQGIGNLTSLNLSGCYNVRDDNLYQAFSMPISTLLHLDLSLCKQITDRCILRIVHSLENLETLELGGCWNVTDIGLGAIAHGLKRLKSLNLRSCWSVSDQGVRLLAGQNGDITSVGTSVLEHLSLQDCQHLTDDALKYISSGLTNIISINLSFCINVSDMGLKYLAKIISLRELNLRACDNVSDAGVAFLAEAASPLHTLDVSFCDKVTDQSLDYMSQGLFNLKCLSLSACHVSDDGISKITEALTELEVLNIGQCMEITDKSLFAIAESFKNLRCVDLYGCPRVSALALEAVNASLSPQCVFNLYLWHVK